MDQATVVAVAYKQKEYVDVIMCRPCYLLKWTLGLDAFPSDKDPVIAEAQITDS